MRRLLPLLALLTTLGHAGERAVADPPPGRAWIDVLVVRGKDPVAAPLELRRLGDVPERTIDRPWMRSRDVAARRLWLEPHAGRGPALAAQAASPEGVARFEGLTPGLYELLARDGPAPEARSLVEIEANGQHASHVMRLSTGHETLTCQLRHADGRPYVGLVVVDRPRVDRVAKPWLDGAWERTTDAEGRFELAGLEPGPVGITALVPGQLRTRLGEVLLPLEAPWTGTLPRLTGGATGSVVEGVTGTPIAGAEVFAADSAYPASGFTLVRVETASDGSFELPNLVHDPELLCVATGRAAAWRKFPSMAKVLAPIQLDAAARIEGLVLAPDGTPVPGVRVVVQPSRVDVAPQTLWARTDSQGRYGVDSLAPIETRIVVSDSAWVSPRADLEQDDGYAPCAELLEPGRTHRLTQRVEPAGWIEGRVLDGEGKGLSGALVHGFMETFASDTTTATDESGRFRLPGLPRSGFCALRVTAPGRRPAILERVSIGARTPDLVLEAVTSRWLHVRVIDDVEGAPIAGAVVHAQSHGRQEGSDLLTRLDETGFLGITGTDGTLWVGPVIGEGLMISASDLGRDTTSWHHIAPTAEGPVTLVPGPRRHELRGRILPPDGGVLPGRLSLVRSDAGRGLGGAQDDRGAAIPVQGDGRFHSEHLPAGRYVLRASGVAEGRIVEGHAHVAAGKGEVTIQLKATTHDVSAVWRFRLMTHDGRPVPHARLWVEEDAAPDKRKLESSAIMDQEHTFVASNPGIGLLRRVVFGEARTLSGRALPYGWTSLHSVEPSEEPITIELPAEGVLEGQVLDPAGRPVRGVRIQAEVRIDTEVASPQGVDLGQSTLSTEDGTFRLGGLRADAWRARLRLGVPPDCAREPRLWTSYDFTPRVLLKLCHAVPGGLRVTDPDGEPVAGCRLRIEPDETDFWTFEDNVRIEGFYSGPGEVYGRTGTDGRGGFTRLDPRRAYSLFVEPPGTRPDLLPVHMPAWRPQVEETLVLRAAPR